MRPKQQMPLAFNKIEPEVLANQLTYLEWKTLRRISASFDVIKHLSSFFYFQTYSFQITNATQLKVVYKITYP